MVLVVLFMATFDLAHSAEARGEYVVNITYRNDYAEAIDFDVSELVSRFWFTVPVLHVTKRLEPGESMVLSHNVGWNRLTWATHGVAVRAKKV